MQQIIIQGIKLEDFKNLIAEVLDEKLRNLSPKETFPNKDYLTRNEAKTLLKISLTTLNDWSKRGIIQSYRIGNRILYKRNEIEDSVKQVKNLKYKRG